MTTSRATIISEAEAAGFTVTERGFAHLVIRLAGGTYLRVTLDRTERIREAEVDDANARAGYRVITGGIGSVLAEIRLAAERRDERSAGPEPVTEACDAEPVLPNVPPGADVFDVIEQSDAAADVFDRDPQGRVTEAELRVAAFLARGVQPPGPDPQGRALLEISRQHLLDTERLVRERDALPPGPEREAVKARLFTHVYGTARPTPDPAPGPEIVTTADLRHLDQVRPRLVAERDGPYFTVAGNPVLEAETSSHPGAYRVTLVPTDGTGSWTEWFTPGARWERRTRGPVPAVCTGTHEHWRTNPNAPTGIDTPVSAQDCASARQDAEERTVGPVRLREVGGKYEVGVRVGDGWAKVPLLFTGDELDALAYAVQRQRQG